jgi:hypothetical protein
MAKRCTITATQQQRSDDTAMAALERAHTSGQTAKLRAIEAHTLSVMQAYNRNRTSDD